jgi:AraC family transcriptional regulator
VLFCLQSIAATAQGLLKLPKIQHSTKRPPIPALVTWIIPAFLGTFEKRRYYYYMILHEFPDLGWLKGQIAQGFGNKTGWGHRILDNTGFPSVIINARSHGCYRPDIKGPFSLFVNLSGESLCTVDRQTYRLDSGNYFVSNQSQEYTLQIEEGRTTETFNIHFGDRFAGSILNALVTPADRILDRGEEAEVSPFSFFNQLYRKDAQLDTLIRQIIHSHDSEGFDKLLFEEQLSGIVEYQMQQHRHIVGIVQQLPPVRKATRIELYKRLSRAVDYMRACLGEELDLETLSTQACLSKFHFLRLFRLAYGLTPHQYIQQLRIEKALQLLAHTSIPVADLAYGLGFANSQSFSRLFVQRMGIYPTHYRERVK